MFLCPLSHATPQNQQKQFLFRVEDAVLVRCDHSIPWTKGIVAGTGELLLVTADSSLGASSLQVQPQVTTRERDSSYLIAFNLFKREREREGEKKISCPLIHLKLLVLAFLSLVKHTLC